jgi:agmatine deiminase
MANEGGAFCVDGEGTLLTTESVLLNPNRNPGMERREIEKCLCLFTGARKIVWLPGNPSETVTDGHVDGLAVSARPGVVLFEAPEDPAEPDYDLLRENRRELVLARDAPGRRFEIVDIHRPPWNLLWLEGFAASYLNFYFANAGNIIMPRFSDASANHAAAGRIMLATGCDITLIDITPIAEGGGGM